MMSFISVDTLLVLFVVVQALWGMRRGFALGVLELLAWIVTLFVSVALTKPVASVVQQFSPMPDGMTGLVVLLGLFGASLALVNGVLSHWYQRVLAPRIQEDHRRVDQVLGVLPGAATGILLAGLLLETALFLPINAGWHAAIMQSRFARPIALLAESVAEPFERLTMEAAQEASALVSTRQSTRPARFALPVTDLAQDTQAERRMLELLNAERTQHGLVALVADERLAQVARQHSTEMLLKSYFAHVSPETGTPFDRMERGGIRYRAAGENLAFAPNVERAHQGLMNSPEHRANILRPEFRKVGIGAMNGGLAGIMFTQNFTD